MSSPEIEVSESKSSTHPTITRYLARRKETTSEPLDHAALRELCVSCGADDVGYVHIDSEHIAKYREKILRAFPRTRSMISFVTRMNNENIRNPARSVANLEFHQTIHESDHTARAIVSKLYEKGIRATNPATGFPMEMDRFLAEEIWVVGHKPVAVAAGLGRMGLHRNVIHPKFGSSILLGTVLLDHEINSYSAPIDYNPCFDCRLCVAACPVGAINTDGFFNFSACLTHNYREFMGGFNDWVSQVIESPTAQKYHEKTSRAETASVWQSLSFGPNYKAAYCLAVCPAGDDVIGQFLDDKANFLTEVVKPLQHKKETIYVTAGTDAEQFVLKHFPNKTVKHVKSGLKPRSVRGFMQTIKGVFQPQKSSGVDATYHFVFTGKEDCIGTIKIANKRVKIELDVLSGTPDLKVEADSAAWLKFLDDKRYLPLALLSKKIKLTGSPKFLKIFGACFVS